MLLVVLLGACHRAGPGVAGPVEDVRRGDGASEAPPTGLLAPPPEPAPWTLTFVDLDTGEVRTAPSTEVPESVAWWEGEGRRIPVVRVEARLVGAGMEIRRYAADGALLDVLITTP